MLKLTLAACAVTLGLALPATAQDAAIPAQLPDICKTGMSHDMGTMKMDMGGMDQAHQDLAMGMDETNTQMMQAMMASDIDVAFVCAMIPHHQGAINMARAELKHGDSQWARDMAQKVIDAQEQEIADMLSWLGEQK
ncbi:MULTISPECIES: DUF305 domain-containing protein [unclassified Devosia]|mgnify:CR=1 FL=1|jgi:uncharacterized protein (DUF305 family)|uniref:DUF305 domain-containing protein n=1 Tax=unclassified Devosia TaxID=196773 RepID=UPI00092A07DB|nr:MULTISPECIES: DUF305 domain-containing protein [unclassified Devosia]OJX48735.1 MAG: hypothetical protein BGO81_18850 [Devosia sp. 66-22]